MAPAEAASPEPPILRACAQGKLSRDAAFEQLYQLYAPQVLGWLAMRVEPADADDLFQDVWKVFYARWRRWEFLPEMQEREARPALSFLYRTCHFALQGHRRGAARVGNSLEAVEVSDGARGRDRLLRQVEYGRCLGLARKLCPPQELDVLLAKLSGVPVRAIARTLEITEAMVDHNFRNAVARLQKELQPEGHVGGRKKNG